MGNHWTLQEAKKNLSAVVEAAKGGEPQQLTAPGGDTFVVLTASDYKRLTGQDLPPVEATAPTKTFVEHLLDFPPLPEGMDDIFDFDNRPQLRMRDLKFEEGEDR
jgi:prevent-host-death family protein